MKLLGKILLLVFVGLGGVLNAAPPAFAAGIQVRPQLQTLSDWRQPGSTFQLAGSGFLPSEPVTITLDGQALTTTASTSSGTIATPVTIPGSFLSGVYTLRGIGANSTDLGWMRLRVRAYYPWGKPSLYWPAAGSTIHFSGYRFAANETVDVSLGGVTVATVVADGNGQFVNKGDYAVPSGAAGQSLNFVMEGRTSHALAAFTGTVRAAVVRPVSLVTHQLVPMVPGQQLWQSVQWLGASSTDACNFQVTQSSPDGVAAVYPSARAFSAPYGDSTLSANTVDYTAVLLNVPATVTSTVPVGLQAAYQPCIANVAQGTPTVLSTTVSLPVNVNTGMAFVQNTPSVTVPVNQAQWVKLYFTGKSPGLPDFNVQVTNLAGTTVIYPSDGTSTKPQNGTSIAVGQKDYVSLHIDTTGLTVGTYVLQLAVSYGNPVVTIPSTVAVVVS